jgi:curved DNA-binding protein CbpA
MSKKNHYKTLGILPEANEKEIRAAYRNLAKKYHPDAGEGSSAETFRAIQEAYDLLSDAEKKKAYDDAPFRKTTVPVHSVLVHDEPRSAHVDLRDVLRRRSAHRMEPEPSHRDPGFMDPWDELFEFFFRRF